MKTDRPSPVHSFLTGSSEMEQLIRSIDWSATLMGPVEYWPQSLRTTLSIILNSKFPMFLFWGPELICFYNDAYRPSLGNEGKHPAAMGMPGQEVWPEIWSAIKPLIDQVLNAGEATWSENQLLPIYRNRQLEDVYWTFSYSPVKDESGRAGGVFVTCMETTEKVRMFEHLQETKDQLSSAIEAAELGTWDANPATGRLVANDRLKDWYGLPDQPDTALTMLFDAIVPADRPRIRQLVATALQSHSDGKYEATYTIVNPRTMRERMLRAKGRAYFDETGKVYRFAGTTQDVTEQTSAREQLKRAEQMAQLAVSGAGAGTFFISLPDDHMVYSPTLSIVFTGEDVAGLTRKKLLDYIFPFDKPLREAAYQQAAKTGKLTYEARTTWHNGSVHWLRVVGAYLYDSKGVAISFSGIAMDITNQRMVQQELERQVEERTRELSNANQTLMRTNYELEQFAYIASHDLQEPLRKIQSFANLLHTNRYNTERFDVYLDKIVTSAQRMSDLIKAVLAYSRLAAKDDLFQQTDLNQILEQVLGDFDLLIEQKEAVIAIDPLPVLTGIPLQLSQLFTNLIGNALKFTDKTPRIDITSTVVSAADIRHHPGLNPLLSYVNIAVRDNGIGFDPQYADRIFALFQRLSSGKSYGGTGIGLALCKKIVENHGGIITASSTQNQGAVFYIYLPVSRSPESN